MDKIINEIVELLQENISGTKRIKNIYKGDPMWIPFNNLPCITVCPLSTSPSSLDSQKDNDVYSVLICVVLDDRTYFNELQGEDTGQFELIKIVEERNSDFTLKDDTVLGILNKTFRYDTDFNLRFDAQSVSYPEGTQRSATVQGNDFYPTREAVITIDVLGKAYSRN